MLHWKGEAFSWHLFFSTLSSFMFILCVNGATASVSGLFCFPTHYLHISQDGVRRCSLVTENASSLHCLHSCAWLLTIYTATKEAPLYPTGKIHVLGLGLYSFWLHKHLKSNYLLKPPFKLTCYAFIYLLYSIAIRTVAVHIKVSNIKVRACFWHFVPTRGSVWCQREGLAVFFRASVYEKQPVRKKMTQRMWS